MQNTPRPADPAGSPQPARPAAPRYCVVKGTAQGAEVIYRPRSDEDRFPWLVACRWYTQYNGWRYAPDSVTTTERYRQLSGVRPGNARTY